ncbi:MAG TPA: CehA/McbA family metallohydrolase [Polyangiaceae bacterium]
MVALFACGPHEDVTPLIHVNPNAAKRGDWIHGAGTQPAAHARVHTMHAGEELGGPNATGKPGDFILENDEVAFVIDQLGPAGGAGFAVSGGNLIDAADAHARKDELGQVITYFGAFPRQGVYETMDSGVLGDGSAFVEARGHELDEKDVTVTTRYTLHGSDRALLLETTLENRGAQPVVFLGLGDAIQWGGTEKIAPDRGRGFKGPSSGSFLGGVGRLASYAIAATDGDIDAENGPSWSDTLQARRTEIPAGKSVHYARVFLVGPRADVSGLVAELTKASGAPVGRLRVTLAFGTTPVAPSDRSDVEIAVHGRPIMDLRKDASGALATDVPPGHYEVRYAGGDGRGPDRPAVAVDVTADHETSAEVHVTAPGRIHVQCKERLDAKSALANAPCKATFEGLGVPNPDFGPAHVAGPARNQVTTKDGDVDVPIAPGRYRVTLSRGPEYATSAFEVDVQPGADVEGACDVAERCFLRRVVDTRGYLACDFHQHTMLGVDAPTNTRDRVIGNVAEGVEIAVATEHNIVADLEPLVREMGLADRLVEIPGDELTTDTSLHPWGHANAFPLPFDADKPHGGALDVRDRPPKELFSELRAKNPGLVIQVNHPRSGSNGYFDLLDFDRATGAGTDPRYDPDFDAIELWNGRNVAQRSAVLDDTKSLLRNSHPVTITGTTDTHGMVGQEAGYPRTYVKLKDDDLGAWTADRSAELAKSIRQTRDVVVTNGPFMQVHASGAGIGGIARARGGHVIVTVEVQSAPWVEANHVHVVRALGTKAGSRDRLDADLKPRLNAAGALASHAQFDLAVDRDDAIFVIVTGDKTLSPVLPGNGDAIRPYAISGAIWLDADGDGKSLGR